MQRSRKRSASHHCDGIPSATDRSCIRPATSNHRLQQSEPSTRRILCDHHNDRTRVAESGTRRLRNDTGCCGSAKLKSARDRSGVSCALPALCAWEDVQRVVIGPNKEIHKDMLYVTIYEYMYITILRARQLNTLKYYPSPFNALIGFSPNTVHYLRISMVHVKNEAIVNENTFICYDFAMRFNSICAQP
jgi:hypothetical protein